MNNQNIKRKKNKKLKIIYFINIVLICTMIISGYNIIKWFKDNNKSEEIKESISKNIELDESSNNYNVNFEELKKMNKDTVAWFKLNGTDIEYPVVKAEDNNYYLTHSFDDSYNSAGWVFMDYKNSLDGTDKNIVIYGHNRRDGSMFGTLKRVLEEEWQNDENNYIIPFITQNGTAYYQVFSTYRVENEELYIKTSFENDSVFESFLNIIKSRSNRNYKTDISKDDSILTLSTCADNNKYRVVLHAKKINK